MKVQEGRKEPPGQPELLKEISNRKSRIAQLSCRFFEFSQDDLNAGKSALNCSVSFGWTGTAEIQSMKPWNILSSEGLAEQGLNRREIMYAHLVFHAFVGSQGWELLHRTLIKAQESFWGDPLCLHLHQNQNHFIKHPGDAKQKRFSWWDKDSSTYSWSMK